MQYTIAETTDLLSFIHHLPIATTLASAAFLAVLLRRYLARRSGPHLLWWAGGVFAYGLGTAIESTITLAGNTVFLTKSWYIAGALLGGYPLAQGSVYLLCNRRLAHVLTAMTIPFIIVAAVCVVLSPVNMAAFDETKPGGAILGWQWVRLLTPVINLYAAAFLIGGAIYSAVRYMRQVVSGTSDEDVARRRALGNIFIAVGAILPGVGGAMAKAGMVEALYIGEFLGILLIWLGYQTCVNAFATASVPQVTIRTA